MLDHSVFPYRSDDQFQTTIGRYLAEGIERSQAILAVTTAPNIELLHEHLGQDARNVEFIDTSDFYSTPVAALDAYKAFTKTNLKRGAAWIRAVGEPPWAEGTDAGVRLWTRYESLFNLALADLPMTVVCPYDERSLAPEIVREAHLTHPHALSDQGVTKTRSYTEPERFALER